MYSIHSAVYCEDDEDDEVLAPTPKRRKLIRP